MTSNQSGWMTQETFCDWIKHFISCVKPSKENKSCWYLMVITHIRKTLKPSTLLENGVLFSLPSHFTHGMQPLDVRYFRLLNHYLAQEQDVWMRTHFRRKIGRYLIIPLIKAAYKRAATMENVVNAFPKSRHHPLHLQCYHRRLLCGHRPVK